MTPSDTGLVKEARQRAEAVLRGNASSLGMVGARRAYQQVTGRDSMICGLALMLLGDAEAIDIHRRSITTLASAQSGLGRIPFNVGLADIPDASFVGYGNTFAKSKDGGDGAAEVVVDTFHAGCIDNSLWYVLGNYYDYQQTRDSELLRRHWPSVRKAYTWLKYQDVNECGLLEVHESMDWADLFANRYNVLFDNVIWCGVHQAMGCMAYALGEDASAYVAEAQSCRYKLNLLLWVGPEVDRDMAWVEENRKEWIFPIKLTDTELVVRPYYLPYMGFREYGDRFDTLGNLLAILFHVADQRQSGIILDYIHEAGLNSPYPVRVLNPVITPGDKDWRDYYRVRNLNQPYQYHNGGIWPFVGGFYVAALVAAGRHAEAEQQLAKLAELNSLGRKEPWEFNEWFHGTSGRPMGFPGQSWSAAMYIYAYECVRSRSVPFFSFDLATDTTALT